MGRHSMDEEPPPSPGRRVATGRHPAVNAPVRRPGEPAPRRPDNRVATGHHLAVEAKAVVPTPPRPPERRVATGRYPAVDPAGLSPRRRDDRGTAGSPPARRPDGRVTTGRRPPVDPPSGGTKAPSRPDGRTSTGQYAPVDAPARQAGNPALRSDGRTATGEHSPVDSSTHQGKDSAARQTDNGDSGQHAAVDGPTRQGESPPRSDGRTATGYHRAVGAAAARRRIAKWPIVVGVLVLLIAVGLGGWVWANNVLESRNAAQAKDCAEGVSTMKVIVAPGVAHPVQAAAAKWNQARTVVHAHCITIDVEPRPSDQVFAALTGHAAPDAIGGIPAAWIPEAPDNWAAQLATARPDLIGTPPEGLTGGFSFVGLGGSAVDEVTVRAAQMFHDFLMDPAQRPDFADAGLA